MTLSLNKKWISSNCDKAKVDTICQKWNISPLVAKVLLSRDITDEKQIDNFLNISENQFLNPFLLPDMNIAVERIKTAINLKEKIAVYGDYDVDGITSTYILYDYLTSLGADVCYYIPDRAVEGYGLNIDAIDNLKKKEISLIITVDVGITAFEEALHANSLGIDLIITDHHTPSETVPEAIAVVNPKLKGHDYTNIDLAGVGVAYKLIYALSGCDKKIMDAYCEFACIGTIADMVPLMGENRFIASYGLRKIAKTKNLGLKALVEVSGLCDAKISSSNISFAIAPRLNASGRLGSAKMSVDLFLTDEFSKAKEIATMLDEGNKQRQMTEQEILKDALDIIEKDNLIKDNVIVVANKGWHDGIIGIVASKITERYYKPTLVISIGENGVAKASGRSISGFNLYDALSYTQNYLDKFGGHELAAGFSLKENNISSFRKAINEYANNVLTDDIKTPKIKIDAFLSVEDLTLKTAKELTILEPYGIGNKTPVFAFLDANIKSVKINDRKHAFVSYKKSHLFFSSPAFNMADEMSVFSGGDVANFAGNVSVNHFRGTDNVQFVIKDVKPSLTSSFTVENLRFIYIIIKDYLQKSKNKISLSEFSRKLSEQFGCRFGSVRLIKAFEVLQDVSIIDFSSDGDFVNIWQGKNFFNKVELNDSQTFKKLNFLFDVV